MYLIKKNKTFTQFKNDPQNPSSHGGLNRLDLNTKRFRRHAHAPEGADSIAHNEVYLIAIDGQGYLWLGRSYAFSMGLEKFDPKKEEFSLFKHDPYDDSSISDDIIMGCYEDRSGILWVVESTGGIDKYDKNLKPFDLYRHQPGNENSLSSNAIPTIMEASNGDIWLSTRLGGLNRFDRKKKAFKRDQQ